METHAKLIIKQINNDYDSGTAVKNVLEYIVRDKESGEDVRYWGAYGASSKSIKTAISQFIIIQKFFKKADKKRVRHFVVSFPEYVDDVNVIRIISDVISGWMFKEYQVVYAVHEKKGNLHTHIVINPVSYKDGRKWHQSREEFQEWKKKACAIVNKQLAKYGYKRCRM